mmetsp:Transcript_11754/g.42941  ORF Transcript_11754/g.42941 Transcript_11754/m.42941 type:complete len:206 (-) Transcript_11754:287-904(-)
MVVATLIHHYVRTAPFLLRQARCLCRFHQCSCLSIICTSPSRRLPVGRSRFFRFIRSVGYPWRVHGHLGARFIFWISLHWHSFRFYCICRCLVFSTGSCSPFIFYDFRGRFCWRRGRCGRLLGGRGFRRTLFWLRLSCGSRLHRLCTCWHCFTAVLFRLSGASFFIMCCSVFGACLATGGLVQGFVPCLVGGQRRGFDWFCRILP